MLMCRISHNWWHVSLCYLEGNAPLEKVREVYDNHIWKELDRSDAAPVEVFTLSFFLYDYQSGLVYLTFFIYLFIYAISNHKL